MSLIGKKGEKPGLVTRWRTGKRQPRWLVYLLMLVSATLVSTSFTVGAAITHQIDPVALTFIRFTLAALLFAPVIAFSKGFSFSFSLFFRAALISSCLVIFFCSMFLSLRYTLAINTSVLFALVPCLSALYSFVLLGERLHRLQFIALGCGAFGVLWVIFQGDLTVFTTLNWNKGDLIFLFGCLFMGLYTPLVKLLHRGESMAVVTFWVLVTGALWLAVFGGRKILAVDFCKTPMFVFAGIAYLSVFSTIITFFLTQWSVPYLGATRVMAYSYLYPVQVLLLDLLLGNGLAPPGVLPGVAVVLVAMIVLMKAGD